MVIKEFKRICRLCKEGFVSKSHNKQYCPICTLEAKRNCGRKYYYLHKEKYSKERDKDYHRRYNFFWKKKNKEKIYAQGVIQYQIKKGEIPKPTSLKCNICKKQAEEYHHPDYNLPYQVLSLCKLCHREIHRKFTWGLKS